jgi:hypothetical protein
VCCDFEDSSIPQEKFYHWTPVKMDDLPKFRLCHKRYWDESLNKHPLFPDLKKGGASQSDELITIEATLRKL